MLSMATPLGAVHAARLRSSRAEDPRRGGGTHYIWPLSVIATACGWGLQTSCAASVSSGVATLPRRASDPELTIHTPSPERCDSSCGSALSICACCVPPQHDEVRFWCCQTLVEGICAHAEELCADPGGTGAAEARRCALEWVTGEAISSVPAYVRNKAAQLWAAAVGEWYGRKPSAFAEAFPALLRASGASERGADMLARCLVSLDEDIISHETGVSEARAGAVKDAMRASGAVVEVFGVSLRCAASCSAEPWGLSRTAP